MTRACSHAKTVILSEAKDLLLAGEQKQILRLRLRMTIGGVPLWYTKLAGACRSLHCIPAESPPRGTS